MIDQAVFKAEWGILETRYNRTFPKDVVARYYQSLSPRMTTADFRVACRILFDRPGNYAFPGPSEFVGVLEQPPENTALDQWELCERILYGETHVLDRMTDEGQKVVRLLGGPVALGQTPVDGVKWVRKEFLDLYGTLADKGDAHIPLPPWTEEGRATLRQIMGEAKQVTDGEPDRTPDLPPYVDESEVVS